MIMMKSKRENDGFFSRDFHIPTSLNQRDVFNKPYKDSSEPRTHTQFFKSLLIKREIFEDEKKSDT